MTSVHESEENERGSSRVAYYRACDCATHGQSSETGEETMLVFAAEQPMVLTMDKPWYRRLFSRSQKLDQEVTHASADYGAADVQFGMGLKFASRAGEAQDYLQAAEWYRKAADQCHPLAQFNLGTMYANGQGVAQDETQSAIWFAKAAQQGDAGAQFNLGRSCHRASLGEVTANTSESRVEAYKWYHLAAAQGYKESDTACTTLILTMSRADVTIANQRVADFEAEQPKLSQG